MIVYVVSYVEPYHCSDVILVTASFYHALLCAYSHSFGRPQFPIECVWYGDILCVDRKGPSVGYGAIEAFEVAGTPQPSL